MFFFLWITFSLIHIFHVFIIIYILIKFIFSFHSCLFLDSCFLPFKCKKYPKYSSVHNFPCFFFNLLNSFLMMVLVLIIFIFWVFTYCITCSNNYYCIFHFSSHLNFVHNFAFHLPICLCLFYVCVSFYALFSCFSRVKKYAAAVVWKIV